MLVNGKNTIANKTLKDFVGNNWRAEGISSKIQTKIIRRASFNFVGNNSRAEGISLKI